MEGIILGELAVCALRNGRRGDAEARWREAVAILRELKDARQEEKQRASMRKACAELGVPSLDPA